MTQKEQAAMNTVPAVGERVGEVVMRPTPLQLFRYSAVTWNTHLIHFDQSWAAHEGYPGVLVHSHLHAANALRAVTDGLGDDWHIDSVSYRVLRPAFAGDALTATAEIIGTSEDGKRLTLAIEEVDGSGETCLEGTVTARSRS
ncbi:MAG: MaoC/PaaZ C-terminal domain-containing protein [Rhodococcus sp. (in: high G+C Gram-positive bacteria)]